MPKNSCDLCGVRNVMKFEWQKHISSHGHQKKLHEAAQKKKTEETGIFVGFRHVFGITKEYLLTHFGQFGEIEHHHIVLDRCFAIIEYKDKESAVKALGSSPYINNKSIIIKRAKPRGSCVERAEENVNGLPKDFKLGSGGSWEDQAFRLAHGLQIQFNVNKDDPLLRNVCHSIYQVLSSSYPNCVPYVFGSCATGLAGKDSDVDIYVDLTADLPAQSGEVQEKVTNIKDETFNNVKNLMMNSPLFRNIIAIPKARIPIVKCVHKNTDVPCDINIKNSLGVTNTDLIKYYLDSDIRIKLLVLTLKHWSKLHVFGNLSSYALTMMAIYYVIQLPDQLVLSPEHLINADNGEYFENGWRSSFWRVPFKTKNQITFKNLIHGFFKFIPKFDFNVDVMCVLTGKSIPKWHFLQPELLPSSQQLLIVNTTNDGSGLPVKYPMCIQDPFELNHNITRGMNMKNVADFLGLCKEVDEYCSNNEDATLEGLCSVKYKNTPAVSNLLVIHMNNYFPSPDKLHNIDIRDVWFRHTKSVIFDVFKYILCLENTSTDLDDTEKIYTGKFTLWNGRKNLDRSVKEDSPKCLFNREIMFSRHMKLHFYPKPDSLNDVLNFKISLNLQRYPTQCVVNITNVSSDLVTMHSMLQYLNLNLQGLVNKGTTEDYQAELLLLPNVPVKDDENLNNSATILKSGKGKSKCKEKIQMANINKEQDVPISPDLLLKSLEKLGKIYNSQSTQCGSMERNASLRDDHEVNSIKTESIGRKSETPLNTDENKQDVTDDGNTVVTCIASNSLCASVDELKYDYLKVASFDEITVASKTSNDQLGSEKRKLLDKNAPVESLDCSSNPTAISLQSSPLQSSVAKRKKLSPHHKHNEGDSPSNSELLLNAINKHSCS